jgi:hypothetical protein
VDIIGGTVLRRARACVSVLAKSKSFANIILCQQSFYPSTGKDSVFLTEEQRPGRPA